MEDARKTKAVLLSELTELRRQVEKLEAANRKERSLREKHEKALLFDSLTSLPNRTLFYNHLEQIVALSRRKRTVASVLFLGIDRFKLINDTLGRKTGDLLLKQMADRLRNVLRSSDILARPGRDEFMILLPHLSKVEDAAQAAERILQVMRPPFQLSGRRLMVNCCIGISAYPGDGNTADDLIRNAYTALMRARENPSPGFRFYSESLTSGAFDRLLMENELRVALEKNQFTLHYQPQVDVRRGRVVGFEALLRWKHGRGDFISPSDFIPIVEDIGLTTPLTDWVIASACRQNRLFQEQGLPPVRMAVNLSPRQLQEPDLVPRIAAILEESSLSPQYLELELTEEALVKNHASTSATLNSLSGMGIHFAVDDFGTGYSSLSYLRHFPLRRLKIAKTFVETVTSDHNNAAISRAIIALAHSLRLNVIAEGVETEEQMRFLQSLGCDEVQGFIFSRAVSAEKAAGILANGPTMAASSSPRLRLPDFDPLSLFE